MEEAEEAIRLGDWNRAALCYARVTQGHPSFEQVSLLLMEAGRDEALQLYLLHTLRRMPGDAHVARSVLCTWVVDTMLRRLNRELQGGGGGGGGGGGAGAGRA